MCGITANEHKKPGINIQRKNKSLEERRQTFVNGMQWTKLTQGQTIFFSNLGKEDLTDELECRGINTNNLSKTELQQELQETLEGL